MRKYWIVQRVIAIMLAIVLLAPLALAGGGGKYFKKGRKYEAAGQWDLAAEQYALAISEDPTNPEYKLHLLRSLSNAALTFMERGKTLAEQGDYEGAYQAFRQAYSYDNTNEMALTRMKDMLQKLGIDKSSSPDNGGDLKKTSLSSNGANNKNVAALATTKFRPQNFSFRDAPAIVIINTIAKQSKLNVVYEDTLAKLVETKKINFELEGVTPPKALEIFLSTQRWGYAQLDRRTIVVFTEALANRQRYEDLLIRTFYIKNSVLDDAAKVLQQAVGSKQIIPIKQLNALVVRDTKENLALVETLLEKVDKAQSEVVLDVNLYEVTDSALVQIGNQIATTGTDKTIGLNGIGGIGTKGLRSIAATGVFAGPLGAAITLPNSSLSLLQSKTIGKLVASTQLRSFEGESASVNIGSRVPIRTATIPTGTVVTNTGTTGTTTGGTTAGGTTITSPGTIGGVEQIQYVDVGLNLEITPTVLNEYVQMKMNIESSNVVPDSDKTKTNNPTFTQRKMKGTSRIKEGETGIVASVMRLDKSEGASGLPVLSFIPIVGRLFSTPNNSSMSTNIVITVSPHVLRAPDVGDSDKVALGPNGNVTAFGVAPTIEEIIVKADLEDRLEAEANGTAPASNPSQRPTVPPDTTKPVVNRETSSNTPNSGVNIKPTSNNGVNNFGSIPAPNNNPAPPTNNAPTQTPPTPPVKPQETSEKAPPESRDGSNLSPVTVMARVLNPEINVGQTGLIGIVLSSNSINLSEANLALRFNPSIIKVTAVRDGGLMSLSGAVAEFNYADAGDTVTINARRPANASPVQAFGQLALIYFQALSPGSADLNLTEAQLLGPNSQTLPITLVNGNVEVKGPNPNNNNGGNGGNGGNDSGDDDDE